MPPKCLKDIFKTSPKVSSRHLQGVLLSRLQYVFKTSSRRLVRMSTRHLQNFFKMSCQDIFQLSCKNMFKTSSKCLQDVIKTSLRHLQDVLHRRPQCVFKTYHQVKLFLLTCLWDVFNTFLRPTVKTVIYRRICLVHTSEKFMISVKNLQEWYKFLKFYFFTLLHLLVSAYTANSWFEHIIAHFEYFFTGHHSKTVWLA